MQKLLDQVANQSRRDIQKCNEEKNWDEKEYWNVIIQVIKPKEKSGWELIKGEQGIED